MIRKTVKRVTVAAMVAALFALGIVPAFAVHHGTNCIDRHNGDSDRTICVQNNLADTAGLEKIEGHADFLAAPFGANDTIQIEFSYVRLWRCIANGNCFLVESVGGATFNDIQTSIQSEAFYSTGWWDLCPQGGDGSADNGEFHAEARYRIRWMDEPGDPWGTWKVHNSFDSTEHPCI